MIKKLLGVVASIFMAVGLISVVSPATANACPRDVVLGVGGVGDGDARVFEGKADVLVKYSGGLFATQEGIDVLRGHVDWWNNNCGSTRLTLTGYSGGALVVHRFLSQSGHTIAHKANAVLYSDPGRPGGESERLFLIAGPPVAGTDTNYGGVPTLNVCYLDDVICNKDAPSGWIGYLNGKHANYVLNPRGDAGQVGERLYW